MKGLPGILAGVCAAIVIACAASPRSAMVASPPMAPTSTGGAAASPHDQIAELDAEIAAQRGQLALPPPAVQPMAAGVTVAAVPSPADDPTCHPAKSETCSTSCTLAGSICSNATKICELAKQLPGDDWAAVKCAGANETCKAAHDKCCGCQL